MNTLSLSDLSRIVQELEKKATRPDLTPVTVILCRKKQGEFETVYGELTDVKLDITSFPTLDLRGVE